MVFFSCFVRCGDEKLMWVDTGMDRVTDAGVEALAARGCGSKLTTLLLEGA